MDRLSDEMQTDDEGTKAAKIGLSSLRLLLLLRVDEGQPYCRRETHTSTPTYTSLWNTETPVRPSVGVVVII